MGAGATRPALTEVVVLETRRFTDERGYFCETFNAKELADQIGREVVFVQDNESLSRQAGTVRGLHYQRHPFGQGKLVRVGSGSVLDVAVDIRPDSPTYLCHVSVELSARNGRQLWIPPGMAHGFCTLEPDTTVIYKVTDYYHPQAERCLHWLDPRLGIEWPVAPGAAVLSAKDADGLSVAEMEADDG